MEIKQRILVAEDDVNLSRLLKDILEAHSFFVRSVPDGLAALKTLKEEPYDVCILDVMMPKMDGFSVAAELQKQKKPVPLLFLTARAMKEDKLKGFGLGADDYITKPFDEEELICRIQAILRRKKNPAPETPIPVGRYLFEPSIRALRLDRKTLRLTEKESAVLHMLCSHKNTLLKRDDLLISLWGDNDYFHGRSLDVFITKLRKYLKEDPAVSIENIHGVGFILNTSDNSKN